MTLDEFFSGRDLSRQIFDALRSAIDDLGASNLRVSKSQVAFQRRKSFAWAWIPGMYLRGDRAPLVLTLSLRRKASSQRWKQVVEPSKGRYTHHLELRSPDDIDDEVRAWLHEAWSEAG
jgi:hypothetical protein